MVGKLVHAVLLGSSAAMGELTAGSQNSGHIVNVRLQVRNP